ncbi:MAG: hypothetical protein EOO88_49120, partial [Pedobacter sp.]
MDELTTPIDHHVSTNKNCIECDSPAVLPGYPNPLCENCREHFIKYPIPKWIKLFAAGLAVLLILSLYKLPGNIITAMHLQKGKTAIEQKKYLTAQKELEIANLAIPGNQETESFLLLAAYYNMDVPTLVQMFDLVKEKQFDDQELLARVNDKVDQAQYFFPDDSFNELIYRHDSDLNKVPIDSFKSFMVQHPENIYASMSYAAMLSNEDDYPNCDSVLKHILEINAGYIPALQLMSSIKRQENQLNESLDYCNQLLMQNQECS